MIVVVGAMLGGGGGGGGGGGSGSGSGSDASSSSIMSMSSGNKKVFGIIFILLLVGAIIAMIVLTVKHKEAWANTAIGDLIDSISDNIALLDETKQFILLADNCTDDIHNDNSAEYSEFSTCYRIKNMSEEYQLFAHSEYSAELDDSKISMGLHGDVDDDKITNKNVRQVYHMEFRDVSRKREGDAKTENVNASDMDFRIIPFEPDSDSTPTTNSNSTSSASTYDNKEEEEKKYKYKIFYTDENGSNGDPFKYQLGLFYHTQTRESTTGIIVEPKFFLRNYLETLELHDHFVFEIFPQIGNQDISMLGGAHSIIFEHKNISSDSEPNNNFLKLENFGFNSNLVEDLQGFLSISDFPITGIGDFRKKDNNNDLNYDLKGAEFNFNTLI
jgi:hypothetical protein